MTDEKIAGLPKSDLAIPLAYHPETFHFEPAFIAVSAAIPLPAFQMT
jgi:hypothetical protein